MATRDMYHQFICGKAKQSTFKLHPIGALESVGAGLAVPLTLAPLCNTEFSCASKTSKHQHTHVTPAPTRHLSHSAIPRYAHLPHTADTRPYPPKEHTFQPCMSYMMGILLQSTTRQGISGKAACPQDPNIQMGSDLLARGRVCLRRLMAPSTYEILDMSALIVDGFQASSPRPQRMVRGRGSVRDWEEYASVGCSVA